MVAQIPLPWQLTDFLSAMGLGFLYMGIYVLLQRVWHRRASVLPVRTISVYGTPQKNRRRAQRRRRVRKSVAFCMDAVYAVICCVFLRAWVLTESRAAQLRWSMIAGVVLAYRGRYLSGLLLTAIFTAFEVKANHVQMTYYYLFIILFMVIAFLVEAIRSHRLDRFAKATAVCFVGAALGICINLSNLYHTWQYGQESMRGKSELVKKNAANQTNSGLDRDYITQWSYGIGDTKTPTVIVLSANALNILGNYMLIYGKLGAPEMGLTGAGISTLLARWVCPVAIYWTFRRFSRNACYRPAFRRARLSLGQAWRIVRGSLPLSLQMSFETGAFSGVAIIAGWLGAVELAAFQIIVVVGMLGFCIYYSVGAATSVIVAHAAGRGSGPEMRRTAWAGYHVMLAVMCVSSAVFIFGGRLLMQAFTDDPAVLALAYTLIFPLVLYQLGDATQVSFANSLRGTGHVVPMFWIALLSYIVAGLPCTYLFAIPLGLGLWGIVLSFSVSLFLAGALFLMTFLRVTK